MENVKRWRYVHAFVGPPMLMHTYTRLQHDSHSEQQILHLISTHNPSRLVSQRPPGIVIKMRLVCWLVFPMNASSGGGSISASDLHSGENVSHTESEDQIC